MAKVGGREMMMKKRQALTYFLVAGANAIPNCLIVGPIFYYLQQWFHNFKLTMLICSLLLISVVIRIILRYLNTQYELKDDSVIVTTGLIDRVTIDFSSYQGVFNCRRSETWLHRLLRVVDVKIAFKNGEDQDEIVLVALPIASAKQIERALQKQPSAHNDLVKQTLPMVRVTFKKLALTGLLSTNCLLVLPLWLDSQQWLAYVNRFVDIALILQPSSWVIGFCIVLVPVLNVFYQIIQYGRFELVIDGARFTVKNGWLNRDAHIIDQSNIQGLEITQTVGMRLLKVCTVSVMLNDRYHDSQAKNILFPFVNEDDLPAIIQTYLPEYATDGVIAERWQFTYLRCVLAVSVGILGGIIPMLAHFPLWTYTIVLVVFSWLMAVIWTDIYELPYTVQISRGVLTKKLSIIAKRHVGVVSQTHVGNWGRMKTVYTDSKPVHKFSDLK